MSISFFKHFNVSFRSQSWQAQSCHKLKPPFKTDPHSPPPLFRPRTQTSGGRIKTETEKKTASKMALKPTKLSQMVGFLDMMM